MDAVEIVAHRGSSFLAPENTLAAVELAWTEGADAVEGDFRLTRDGQIVCLHDATLERTAGVNRPVADCTLDELKKHDVGAWKGPQFAGVRIPTLDELLGTVPSGKRFYVEVKCGPEIIEPLCQSVNRTGLKHSQIVPICLDLAVCKLIKNALPNCPVYWVVDFKRDADGNWLTEPRDLVGQLDDLGHANLDGLDLMASAPIDREAANVIKSHGFSLCAWTVDDPRLAQNLVDLGFDALTTNRPGWLREQLRI
jgi:glycerophosphoryl diester phosphodiesterase